MANSHVKLRNCIEHHHGTPNDDLDVIVHTIKIPPIGTVVVGPLKISIAERTIRYPGRTRIELSYEDVKDIVTTNELVILNAIHQAALGSKAAPASGGSS